MSAAATVTQSERLTRGNLIDIAGEVRHLRINAPRRWEEHEKAGCKVCICIQDQGFIPVYSDLLFHWKLDEIRLEPCCQCGRGFPNSEYITCDLAAICRSCGLLERHSRV